MDQGTEDQGTGNKPTPQAARNAFDQFWSIYPRKVAKDRALKAWMRKTKNADLTEVLEGARRFVNDPNLPDLNYIPHPTTWINGGNWNDGPCPPPPARINGATVTRPIRSTTDDRVNATLALAQRYAAEDAAARMEITR